MLLRTLLDQPALIYSVLCALCCALISDVVYMYPVFGPSLSTRLGHTKLQSNIAAATGNVGLFLMEPIMGDVIDRNGPQGICLLGAGLFAASFSGLAALYGGYFTSHTYMLSILFLFLMGAAAAAVEEAAFSTIARNFPSRVRGTMLGLLYMFFCLSGFFYSWMSSRWFADTADDQSGTYRFLIAATILTSVTPLVTLPGLRWLPGADAILAEEAEEALLVGRRRRDSLQTISNDECATEQQAAGTSNSTPRLYEHCNDAASINSKPNYDENSSEKSPLLITYRGDYDDDYDDDDCCSMAKASDAARTDSAYSSSSYSSSPYSSLYSILHDVDFWLFWSAVCMAVGVDLMFVNNLGHVAEQLQQVISLYQGGLPATAGVDQTQLALNTSLMLNSIAGCVSGLVVGYASDWCRQRFSTDRMFFFTSAALLQTCCLLAMTQIDGIIPFYVVSALSGVSSGMVFTIITVIVSDYWGTEHCGRNVGLLGWAIALGSQLFGSIFGAIFDARQDRPNGCTGRMCYRDGFFVAAIGCALGVVLSVVIHRRRCRPSSI
ncbi:major facilitator superfamily domain-containing protein [Syncephalis pseudoplumigaleata]|uniref:Major facilitator superfamily domain-containing protein n=1 Tax=Syncephalis pseudoplumigaleata TaxID=1712513 RepID=A0A4V1J1H8_9FUNG|nr:major facilitator superfamily domain-containing protein [Syncephalis pseudoplumigaleata]|eukprot:RKP25109.1 major facilitator superfamily domain-containing protein [Syncephalis pseudoplumigaleata]